MRFRFTSSFSAALACAALTWASLAHAETFILEWRNSDDAHPWLREVKVVGRAGTAVETRALPAGTGELPHRQEITLTAAEGAKAEMQVRLAGDYGFVVSAATLRAHPYVWVKDLGLFISRQGWTATAEQRKADEARVAASFRAPFESTAERYYNWSGLTEHEPDDVHRLIWDFIDAKERWPAEARAMDRIAALPQEVDVAYFEQRVPDLKYAKMFLGWAEHNDQFVVWSNGKVTISSQSVGGTDEHKEIPWHPQAPSYSFRFAAGDTPLPRYREYGDPAVTQRLEDGHNLIVTSEWQDGAARLTQTSFAVPLGGNAVRTGIEPLVLWSKVTLTNTDPSAREAWLGLEFTDEDFVTFRKTVPLPDVARITWRDGAFYLGGRLLAAADPALAFEALPSHGNMARFRARVALPAGGARSFTFAHLYRQVEAKELATLRSAGYEASLRRMTDYWNGLAARGADIRVPDAWLNNLYRTFLPRLLMCAHPDPEGMVVMHTGPIQYARVWHHVTSHGLAGDLARRGQFEFVRRYFEPMFKWQDVPAPDSPAITDWNGFFGAPPVQCPKVWMSYQGTVLWAASRYYDLSADRAWLDTKLPALIRGMEWIARTRRVTKRLGPDGSKPLNYGWFPPGRASDSAVGSSIFSDANLWFGLHCMAGVLREIGHPRAAEFQAEADDYRVCLQTGERRSAAERPLLRLNDGTWVPYLPSLVDSTGNERGPQTKYPNVMDAAWAWGILDTRLFPAGSPEPQWLMHAWEDSYATLNPGLSDEPFSRGLFDEYLDQDRVANFLYAFYSLSANALDRETLTTFEHRSWGQKRAFELTPWAAGYWTTNFTNMLCRTVDNELWLLQATPRRWLREGESIEVKNLQTEFGPVSFQVRSRLKAGVIEARIDGPQRQAPGKMRLRLRAPDGAKLKSVTIDGRAWKDFDATSEWIVVPTGTKTVKVEARYR